LEACLSALNNDEIVEMVERSQDVSGSSPIDGQVLLTSILPPILSEPGKYKVPSMIDLDDTYLH
jgi:hypothetical protein